MAEVDSLTIKVYADTTNAVTSIKNVTRAVKELNDSASDRGWRSFTNSVTKIGDASKGMGKLVSSLKRIEGMQISPALKENLDKIADAGAKLSDVGKGIYQFGYGLSKLSQAGESSSKLGENLRRVSSHVIDLSKSLSKFVPQDFASKVGAISQLANTVKKFSKIGEDKDLKTKFSTVATAVANFATQLNNAISDDVLDRLERISQALTDISNTASTAGKAVKAVSSANNKMASDSAKAITTQWKTVISAIETVNKTLSEIGSGLYGVLDASGIISDLDSMSGAVSRNIPILGELTSAWKASAAEIKNIILSQSSVIDKAADLMLVKVKRIVTLLYSFAKIPFSSSSLKATFGLLSFIKAPLKDLANGVSSLTKKWNGLLASISRIGIYRLLRTALKELAAGIKEGIQNLYQWAEAWRGIYSSADRFLASMDQLATAFFYLKNAAGAAVSPLIDYIAPAVDYLIDKFVALTNAINQALAALTGAGVWRKAIKYPITYAEAANLASSKVKALKRSVLAFDELNRLDDKNKGGSNNWTPDYSQLFEEMPVDSWIKSILDSTSWRILGTGIADKINEALSSINWDKINSTVRIWARRLGSFLDGLLMGVDMPLVGKSIAEGLNTIAKAINTFFKELHFRDLGQHLADGFKSMINDMSWDEIGTALTQKWKALFELVIGFKDVDLTGFGDGLVTMFSSAIDNIPISDFVDAVETLALKIGTELGIALNGLFTKTNEVMNGIDGEGLGTTFTTALDNMIKEIRPEEAGQFLVNGIKKIIEFSTGVLKNDSFWTDLNTWLGNLVTNMFKNIDLKTGVQNAVDFAQKIVNLLTTVVNSIPWEDVGNAISSADTSGLKEGFKNLFNSVTDGLERAGFMDEIATGVATYFGLKIASALAKSLPTFLSAHAITSTLSGAGAAGGAAGGVLGSFGGITGLLGMDAATVMGAGTFAEIAAYIGTGLVGALAAWFGGQEVGKLIGKWIFPDDASYYDDFSWFGENGFFQAVLDEAKFEWEDYTTQIKAGWDVIKNAFSSAKEKLSGIMDTLKQKMDNLSNSWSSGTNVILDGLSALTGANLSVFDKGSTLDKARRTTATRITRRASGGMVDKGDLFLAGENGPEIVTSFGGESAVMNMDQIISTISQSVAVAGGGDITIPISLDGGLLDKVIVTAQQRQSLRSGR